MKKIFLVGFLFIMCFTLVGCEDNSYDIYTLNGSSEYDSNDCVSCLESIKGTEAFCNNEETIIIKEKDVKLKEAINDELLTKEEFKCLEDKNVIDHLHIPGWLNKIIEWLWPLIRVIVYII